jgi:uncharacterized integral membrane protein (TIGR00698 family)
VAPLSLLPGFLLALAVAAVARGAHGLLPPTLQAGVSEIVLAVGFGLLVRRLVPWRADFDPGVRFAFHTVLRTAIVILGLRFSLQEVGAIGGRAVVLVMVLMIVALVVAYVGGRLLGVSRRVATLIGVGTAVCGNSAISATAPVIGARDEELSYAVAVNTLFGTVAVFVYPVLGDLLGMTAAAFGTWVGTAVNDTSQVVATGFARGDAAGEIATAVKLTRNALMGFVIVAVGWLHGGAASVRSGSWSQRVRASVPGFVVGFLLLAVANTVGWVEAAGDLVGRDLAHDGGEVAKLLVLIALAGVGLGTRLRSLRAIGPRPLVLGLGTAVVTSVLALSWIVTVGSVVG